MLSLIATRFIPEYLGYYFPSHSEVSNLRLCFKSTGDIVSVSIHLSVHPFLSVMISPIISAG